MITIISHILVIKDIVTVEEGVAGGTGHFRVGRAKPLILSL